jgi:hypothetical protein
MKMADFRQKDSGNFAKISRNALYFNTIDQLYSYFEECASSHPFYYELKTAKPFTK